MSAKPATTDRHAAADAAAAPEESAAAPTLTDDERQAAAAAFAAELMEEHERRVAKAQRLKQRNESRAAQRDEAQRTRELNDLKDQVRAKFYREKGYRRYHDSTGRELWLTAEEYELRMARRKSRRRTFEPETNGRLRTALMYLGMLGVAVVMGFLLAR